MIETLNRWLSTGAAVPVLRGVQLLALALCTHVMWRLMRATAGRGRDSVFTALRFGFSFAFMAVLAYQATWQVGGFARPAFMRFVRRYDARPQHPDKLSRRGRILDHEGRILAEPGLDPIWERHYPLGAAAAHTVGYVDRRYGFSGLEAAADARLSGYGFGRRDERERFARNLLDRRDLSGTDLRTTLDARLQVAAYAALAGRTGAVVGIDPRDGAVRVLVSTPGFDPERPTPVLHARDAPMMNRALHGRYPPGSIFKLIVAAAAIESNVGLVYDCAADGFRVSPGARPIRDYAYYAQQRTGRVWRGFGRIGLTDGFAHSANTYFAQLALACGADALSAHVKDAWLEKRLTLYAGETGSIVSGAGDWPVSETRTAGALAQLGIGQGRLLVTPLHAALWTAATAGDGHLLGPRLDADAPPVVLGRWVNAATAAQLRDLMRAVVRDGTGRGANLPGLNVGGKTGTAQTGAESHAWFICFAGRYTPVLALAVLVEHGGTGAAGALPVAVAVLREAQRVGIFETTETVAVPRNREADGRLREGL